MSLVMVIRDDMLKNIIVESVYIFSTSANSQCQGIHVFVSIFLKHMYFRISNSVISLKKRHFLQVCYLDDPLSSCFFLFYSILHNLVN